MTDLNTLAQRLRASHQSGARVTMPMLSVAQQRKLSELLTDD